MSGAPSEHDLPLEPAPLADERADAILECRDDDLVRACAAAAELPSPGRRHVAELQWLDALLSRLHRPEAAESKEQRIQRVLAALPSDLPSSNEKGVSTDSSKSASSTAREFPPLTTAPENVEGTSRRRWATPFSVAAAVMLALFFGRHLFDLTPSAIASVEMAIAESAAAPSREYEVTSLVKRPSGEREVVSTLFVRGAQRFALNHPMPRLSGSLWVGCDGEKIWMAPPVGPIVVSENRELLNRVVVDQKLSTPFLQVTSVLARLKERYALETLPDESMPDFRDPESPIAVRHVRGVLRANDDALPATIDLWLRPRTGVVHRMTLSWQRPDDAAGPRKITFLLKDQPELPANFYEHGAHHGSLRRVIGE